MPRRIQTVSLQATGGGAADGFFDRIIKYIPADVVAAWTAGTAAVAGAEKLGAKNFTPSTVLWIWFALLLIFTPIWVLRQTAVANAPPAKTQAIVATAAYVVWVFALGAPFDSFTWYNGLFGTLAIIGFTLASGLVIPKEG